VIDPGLQDKSRVFHAFAGQFRPANRPKIENAQIFWVPLAFLTCKINPKARAIESSRNAAGLQDSFVLQRTTPHPEPILDTSADWFPEAIKI
jgi:hypothetical protein